MLTNALIWKISLMAGGSALVAFVSGLLLGSGVTRRGLARFLLTATAKCRSDVQRGDPRALVEAAGVQSLSLSIMRDFLRGR
jgi:hypothetical protein